MVITNFHNNKKITNIIYAQEDFENKGNYLIKDLVEYLELANISFILTSFENNYTVANHIESKTYSNLMEKLNTFSNDIMALNLNHLFEKSSKSLIQELHNINDIAIKSQAYKLSQKIETLTDYKGKKRYQIYFELSKDLFDKNYMLLSLSLLFESIRMYIKTTIKKQHPALVENIEKQLNNNLYHIADFFKNLKWKEYDRFEAEQKKNKKPLKISNQEYNQLKKSFPTDIIGLYDKIDHKRNNLAHANSDNQSFKQIKEDIEKLLEEYEELCIKPKNMNNLKNHFNNL